MKTIELSGIIELQYCNGWNKIKLVQKDGYKVDLILRAQEAMESYPEHKVQVSYYISEKPCSKQKVLEQWLNKISGSIEANYEKNDYAYSSWASQIDYDENFMVGNHNIYTEFLSEQGKYLIMEINFIDKKEK